MLRQTAPDQSSPPPEGSLDAILQELGVQPSTEAHNPGEPYNIPSSNLRSGTAPQPVTLNDNPLQDIGYAGLRLSFSVTNTPRETLHTHTRENVDQAQQLSLANLGWHDGLAPYYSTTLSQGLPVPSHGLDTLYNAPTVPTPSYQQQQQQQQQEQQQFLPNPRVLPHRVVAPSIPPQLASSSSSHQPLLPDPQPSPRVAFNSNGNHPLLAKNFRELSQAKERDRLVEILHSEWFKEKMEEPQEMGKSILTHFLQRPNPQSSLRCSFDGCAKTFDRQDRAVAHIRQHHLDIKPYACEGACGKQGCKHRSSSWAYLRSHVNKIKATCSRCDREFDRKNLSRHTASCRIGLP